MPVRPVVMDWFSAQLASQVKQKNETRKKPNESVTKGNTHPVTASNKDAVLAAKFPHKRKLLSSKESLDHRKRTNTSATTQLSKLKKRLT